MGRNRNRILGSMLRPRKAKGKKQATQAARKAKDKKDFDRYLLMSPEAFGDTDDYRAAHANAMRVKQQRTVNRARMCSVDSPLISVTGCTVLLPNTTFPAASATYEDEHGVQQRTWRLGDGGSVDLMLLGVDPRSLSAWLDSFSASRIKCVIPGQAGTGAPIFARARIIQRTTESGRALQPVAEVTKAIVMNAPSFVAGFGKVSAMGEVLQGATGFVRDSSLTGADAARRAGGRSGKAAGKALAEARATVSQHVTDDQFGLNDVNVTVGIEFSIAGEAHEEIGRGIWSLANRHTPAFQRVMRDVHKLWSGT